MQWQVTHELEVVSDDTDVAVRLRDVPVLRIVEHEAAALGVALLSAAESLELARRPDAA